MTDRSQILEFLAELAPLELAESWDNVGLLLGADAGPASTVLTCLTLTPDVAAEAVSRNVDLIVSHHPILFRPIQRLTTQTSEGAMLLELARAGVSVYSPHTAYDSAARGINAQLADVFSLTDVTPIRPLDPSLAAQHPQLTGLGSGRIGDLAEPTSLGQFAARVAELLPTAAGVQTVGTESTEVSRVAIACGSAAEFLRDARRLGADVLLTGEARFHACLEARDLGIHLVIAGHYATERPAVERLAERLGEKFPDLDVFPSGAESDPLRLSDGRSE